jgi:NAD(P)-dependent dehydrogenase (short-subunit alcohol dehydrogenase family)
MTVAVITGASRGLGAALAQELGRRGWDLVVDARGAEALGDIPGHRIAGDVTDPAHRAALADAAAALGGADLLVNNASTLGASPMPLLADLDEPTLRRTLEVNLVAPQALTRLLLPQLTARRGVVLDLTSDAAVEPYPGWGAYGVSKAGLDHLARILAAEHPGLRVYALDPGDMRTRMHQDAFPGEDISDRPDPSTVVPRVLSLLASGLPSGRYLASDPVLDASPAPTADGPVAPHPGVPA